MPGLFSNNDELADRLIEAGKAVGEQVWRLPLAESYDREIDSDAADVKNIGGGRAAGSIIGAQFLQRFVNDVPWAHLDIAGTAWSTKDAPTVPKGATAFGVRLLDRFVSAVLREGLSSGAPAAVGRDRLLPPAVDAARAGPAEAPRAGLRAGLPDRRPGRFARAGRASQRGAVDLRGGGFPAARLGARRQRRRCSRSG